MRTLSFRGVPACLRLLAVLVMFLLPILRAQAQVSFVEVDLAGTQFGHALPIHVDSGSTHLQAATSYQYKISGTVHATGLLSFLYPIGTPLEDFIDDIEGGGAEFLEGTYANPSGTLPITIISRTYAGNVSTAFGTFHAELTITGSAAANGTVSFDVSNVTVTLGGNPITETIVFEGGSKLAVGVPPAVQWAAATALVDEDAGTVTLTVNRTGNPTGEVKVNYATSNGTAKKPKDYTATSGQLTIASGATSGTVTVPIIDNHAVDGARDFKVTLSSPVLAELGTTKQVTVTIVDDEVAAVIEFDQASLTVPESAGKIPLTVRRTVNTVGVSKVKYTVTPGTAKSGKDYQARSGTLTFADGEDTQDIEVTIVDDVLVNPDLDFTVTLSAPVDAVLGAKTAETVTITDDDISFADQAGTYTAPVAAGMPDAATSGILSLTLGPTGSFTAKVTLAGKVYTARGRFSTAGVAGPLPLSKKPPLSLSLVLDFLNLTIGGTIDTPAGTLASFTGDRSVFTKAGPFNPLGTYNVILAPATPGIGETPASFPTGFSFGRLTVKSPGSVKFVGKLADKTSVSVGGILRSDRQVVLYLPLYSKGGVLTGLLAIDKAVDGPNVTGTLSWLKPERSQDKLFPDGFGTTLSANGALFVKADPLLSLSEARIFIGDGNLGARLGKSATISTKNVVTITTNPDDNKTKFTINKNTGAFGGSFVPTGGTKAIPFTGLLLPGKHYGGGFFLGTPPAGTPVESGYVEFKRPSASRD